MTRNHEKLLIAALAGMIIAGAAAFAFQPALASTTGLRGPVAITAPAHEVLTLRLGHA